MKVASFCTSGPREKENSNFASIDGVHESHTNGGSRDDEGYTPDMERSVLSVLIATIMTDGPRGLYQGLGLQLLKTALASAFLYMWKESADEFVSRVIRSIRENRINEGRSSRYIRS